MGQGGGHGHRNKAQRCLVRAPPGANGSPSMKAHRSCSRRAAVLTSAAHRISASALPLSSAGSSVGCLNSRRPTGCRAQARGEEEAGK